MNHDAGIIMQDAEMEKLSAALCEKEALLQELLGQRGAPSGSRGPAARVPSEQLDAELEVRCSGRTCCVVLASCFRWVLVACSRRSLRYEPGLHMSAVLVLPSALHMALSRGVRCAGAAAAAVGDVSGE